MNTLLERFREKYEKWSGKVHVAKTIAEIAPILKDRTVAAAGLSEDLLREIRKLVAGLREPREAELGITGAAFAIADTGTLVEISSADEVRRTSTLPGVHVGIVRESDIIGTLDEAASRVREAFDCDGNMAVTFISGPSRTADIELRLTLGVHGPKEAHAFVLTG